MYLLTFSLLQWYSQLFPWVGTLLPWQPFQILLLQESCPKLGSSEEIPILDLPAGEKRMKMKQEKEWLATLKALMFNRRPFFRNRYTLMYNVWLLFLSVSVHFDESFWNSRYFARVFHYLANISFKTGCTCSLRITDYICSSGKLGTHEKRSDTA